MPQPYVHIELDKPRKLRFRSNDLADLEERTGRGVNDLASTTRVNAVRLLLCYGLRWQDKPNEKMTPAKAGDLIDVWIANGGKFKDIEEKLLEALRAAGFSEAPPTADAAGADGSEAEPEGNAPPEAPTE